MSRNNDDNKREMVRIIYEDKQCLKKYLEKHVTFADDRHFHCPNTAAHENGDKTASAGLTDDGQGFACCKCGFKGNIFDAVSFFEGYELRGKGFVDAVKHIADMFGIRHDLESGGGKGGLYDGYIKDPLYPEFVYTDKDGKPLHKVERWIEEKAAPGKKAKKQFPQYIFDADSCKWVNMGKYRKEHGDFRLVIYNMPAVSAAIGRGEGVYFVEGEKCAEILKYQGATATAITRGSGGWKKPDSDVYAEQLKGADVVILPDNDNDGTGIKFARKVAEGLHETAKSVKILELNGLAGIKLKNKDDIEQWLNGGGSISVLNKCAAKAPVFVPEPKGKSDVLSKGYDIYDDANPLYIRYGHYEHQRGSASPTPICDFTLVPEKVAINKKGVAFVGFAKSMYDKNSRIPFTLRNKDFNEANAFRSALNSASLPFWGDVKDLQLLMSWLAQQELKRVSAVDFVGVHEIDDRNYFIGTGGGFDSYGEPYDSAEYFEDDKHETKSTDWIEAAEITGEELCELMPDLLGYNTKEITVTVLGLITAYVFNSKFERLDIKAPYLFFLGEGGSGKSQTFENLVLPFFGVHDWLNAGRVSNFMLERADDACNVIPIVLNEYKPSRMNENQIKIVSGFLRNAYDHSESALGTENKGKVVYKKRAPVILCGEADFSETAIKERAVILRFDKSSHSLERKASILKVKANKETLTKLGKSLLLYSLGVSDDVVNDAFIKACGVEKGDISDRNRDGYSVVMTGLILFDGFLRDKFGLSLKSAGGVSVRDAIDEVARSTFELQRDNETDAMSDIAATFETLELMAQQKVIREGEHYAFIHKGDFSKQKLVMDIKACMVALSRYIDENDIKDETIKDMATFKARLKSKGLYRNTEVYRNFAEAESTKFPAILTSKLETMFGIRVLCGKSSAFALALEIENGGPKEWA